MADPDIMRSLGRVEGTLVQVLSSQQMIAATLTEHKVSAEKSHGALEGRVRALEDGRNRMLGMSAAVAAGITWFGTKFMALFGIGGGG